jgi:hypothetical protein
MQKMIFSAPTKPVYQIYLVGYVCAYYEGYTAHIWVNCVDDKTYLLQFRGGAPYEDMVNHISPILEGPIIDIKKYEIRYAQGYQIIEVRDATLEQIQRCISRTFVWTLTKSAWRKDKKEVEF